LPANHVPVTERLVSLPTLVLDWSPFEMNASAAIGAKTAAASAASPTPTQNRITSHALTIPPRARDAAPSRFHPAVACVAHNASRRSVVPMFVSLARVRTGVEANSPTRRHPRKGLRRACRPSLRIAYRSLILCAATGGRTTPNRGKAENAPVLATVRVTACRRLVSRASA